MPRTIVYPSETLSQNDWFEYIYNLNRKTMPKNSNTCDYVRNKGIRASTAFAYRPEGKSFYRYEGREIPEKEFEAMFPIQLLPILPKGANPDRRKAFVHEGKSY